MEILAAFKYELMPTGQQAHNMRRFAGSCRFVFNKALALQKERYESGEKKLGYAGLCKQLTEWRNGADTPWLKDSPIHPAQQALKDLELAYSNFFAKRADFPRFKKKGNGDSFRYPDPKQIKLERENGRIFLPKLGWIRYRNSRLARRTSQRDRIEQGRQVVRLGPHAPRGRTAPAARPEYRHRRGHRTFRDPERRYVLSAAQQF